MVDRIVALIKQKGLSISAVEKQLGFGNGAIKRFSTSSPSADKVILLSNFLNVSADYLLTGKEKSSSSELTDDEKELLTYYKKLPQSQKDKTIGRLETLVEVYSEKRITPEPIISETAFKKSVITHAGDSHTIAYYDQPVSAGTGIYLNDGHKEPLNVRCTNITSKADFALRISGNSMEPTFYNEDIILVRYTPILEIGDIGIFILNGEGFVKKFGGDRLISLSQDYDDILFDENDDIRCQGRVLGVLSHDCIVN